MEVYNIIHQDSEVNDKFIDTLFDEWESVFEDGKGKMKVIRGKLHDYLGMTLDYSVKGQVNIIIMNYINKILECLNKAEPNFIGTKSIAALLNLFVADEDCAKLRK